MLGIDHKEKIKEERMKTPFGEEPSPQTDEQIHTLTIFYEKQNI
jgi:hypothetical protein